jgi:hypothetical protein
MSSFLADQGFHEEGTLWMGFETRSCKVLEPWIVHDGHLISFCTCHSLIGSLLCLLDGQSYYDIGCQRFKWEIPSSRSRNRSTNSQLETRLV